MRALSVLLVVLAAVVAAVAILFYLYVTSLACGFAPGASSCQAWPWQLGRDDRLWLVQLPSGIVLVLVALATWARRKARRGAGT
jgi:hypothetical protein